MTARPKMRSARAKAPFGSRTDVGCVRDHNEDSLIATPPLFVVADGMGGHAAGEVASEIAVSIMQERAPRIADAEALSQAVVDANMEVIEAALAKGRQGMGTTLPAAVLDGEHLVIAQVGDSRAYLLHEDRLHQITRDHSLMAELIYSGEITEEQARTHPQRSVITRALGSDPEMLPDIYELRVSAGDRLLLCSDGLNTMLDDGRIQRIMQRNGDPQRCANALVSEAVSEGGLDNVTVIVVDIEGNAPAEEQKVRRKGHIGAISLVLALVLIAGGVVFGTYRYTQSTAYLIAEDGVVCVYKGIPSTFMGFPLSTLEERTGVKVADLQPGISKRLQEGPVRVDSLEAADDLVAEYQKNIAESKKKEQQDDKA